MLIDENDLGARIFSALGLEQHFELVMSPLHHVASSLPVDLARWFVLPSSGPFVVFRNGEEG